MYVPPSPNHDLVIPNQAIPAQEEQVLPAPIQAQNPPDQDDDYLENVDYGDDEDEEPNENLADENEPEDDPDEDPEEVENMILDDDDDDMEVISDDDEEEEEPLQADVIFNGSPPPLSPMSPFIPVSVTPATGERPYIIRGPSSTYEVGGPSNTFPNFPRYEMGCLRQDVTVLQNHVHFLSRAMHRRETEISSIRFEAVNARKRTDLKILDMSDIQKGLTRVEDIVLDPINGFPVLRNKVTRMDRAQYEDGEQIKELERRVASTEMKLEIAQTDRCRLEIYLYNVRAEMQIMFHELRGSREFRPNDAIDVLAAHGNNNQPEPHQSPNS